MFDFEMEELRIEKIDTTKKIPTTPVYLVQTIAQLQEKMNEIIDVLNIITMPGEHEFIDETDETELDEDGEIIIGKPVSNKK